MTYRPYLKAEMYLNFHGIHTNLRIRNTLTASLFYVPYSISKGRFIVLACPYVWLITPPKSISQTCHNTL